MKARGLASPDLGDTLAMAFAVNVNTCVGEEKEWFAKYERYRFNEPRPDARMV